MSFETGPKYTGVTMQEALEELFADQDRVVERPREYVLSEVPKAEELQKLCSLPFEVSIRSQADDRLVLATGQEYHTVPINYLDETYLQYEDKISALRGSQFNESKIDFHSHPLLNFPQTSLYPSPGDYRSQISGYRWAKVGEKVNPMLIATDEALIVISDRDDRSLKKMEIPKLDKFEEQILSVLEEDKKQDIQKESELVEILKELKIAISEYLEINYILWSEARPVIDKHMNPENFK